MELNKKETCTVLAALRHWQEEVQEEARWSYSAHFIDALPLTNSEIDILCEKINFDKDELFHACKTMLESFLYTLESMEKATKE